MSNGDNDRAGPLEAPRPPSGRSATCAPGHHHYDRPGGRVERRAPPPVTRIRQSNNDPGQRPEPVDAPRGQQRIVGQHRAAADRNGVDLGALAMKEPIGGRAGDPDPRRPRRPTNPSADDRRP